MHSTHIINWSNQTKNFYSSVLTFSETLTHISIFTGRRKRHTNTQMIVFKGNTEYTQNLRCCLLLRADKVNANPWETAKTQNSCSFHFCATPKPTSKLKWHTNCLSLVLGGCFLVAWVTPKERLRTAEVAISRRITKTQETTFEAKSYYRGYRVEFIYSFNIKNPAASQHRRPQSPHPAHMSPQQEHQHTTALRPPQTHVVNKANNTGPGHTWWVRGDPIPVNTLPQISLDCPTDVHSALPRDVQLDNVDSNMPCGPRHSWEAETQSLLWR